MPRGSSADGEGVDGSANGSKGVERDGKRDKERAMSEQLARAGTAIQKKKKKKAPPRDKTCREIFDDDIFPKNSELSWPTRKQALQGDKKIVFFVDKTCSVPLVA